MEGGGPVITFSLVTTSVAGLQIHGLWFTQLVLGLGKLLGCSGLLMGD